MLKATWIAAVLLLAGCAGTQSNVRQPLIQTTASDVRLALDNYGGMSPEGRSLLESRLAERLGKRLNSSAATELRVRVSYYRVKPAAARLMVGVLAGQDRITSDVSIVDAAGNVLGQTTVDSKNPTAVFTANGLVRGHADAIADFVLNGRVGTTSSTPATANQECASCARIGKEK